MIWIRADANKEIGTGHIMRCLSVASELKKSGEQVKFLVADDEATGLLQKKGQEYHVLNSNYRDMEAELDRLLSLMSKEKPKLILVDSYFVTDFYLEQLSDHAKTAYVDDMFAFSYPVDMVINYNIYGDLLPYREKAHSRNKDFLLGCVYAPLREEFQAVSYQIKDEVENVLITTGGSDKYNLAGQILKAALADEKAGKLHYHVVSGAFNSHLEELQQLEAENPQVHIHKNVKNMAELMRECDIAVTAGGSTMYELCAVGVPIICFSFVDNQEQIVETFVKKSLVCYGGNYLQDGEKMIADVVKNILQLAEKKEVRENYSRRLKEVVDGNGASRIAKKLQNC